MLLCAILRVDTIRYIIIIVIRLAKHVLSACSFSEETIQSFDFDILQYIVIVHHHIYLAKQLCIQCFLLGDISYWETPVILRRITDYSGRTITGATVQRSLLATTHTIARIFSCSDFSVFSSCQILIEQSEAAITTIMAW